MTARWCPACASPLVGSPCETCARRQRYGLLVEAVRATWEFDQHIFAEIRWMFSPRFLADAQTEYWDALEALAEVMRDRHLLIRAHRRELNLEVREQQRAASESYAQGKWDGAAEARDRW